MPSQAHYKTLAVAFCLMLFTSVLHIVHCSLAHGKARGWGGRGAAGGLHHSHMADDASLPTYFQFRPVFINNLHFLGAHLGGYLPHNLRQVQTLCTKEEERGSRFDKWMSGDETKISRSMKGERGRGKSINPTPGCFRREGRPG